LTAEFHERKGQNRSGQSLIISWASGVRHMAFEHPGIPAVLVADDEPIITELLGAILSREGYMVLPAPNADEALATGRTDGEHLSVALLDYSLPGETGKLAAYLNGRPEVRIILMSGYTESVVRDRKAPYSVYEFLQKPFTRNMVMAVIGKALAASVPAVSPRSVDHFQDGAGAQVSKHQG